MIQDKNKNKISTGRKLKILGAYMGFLCIFGAFAIHRLFMSLMAMAGVGIMIMFIGMSMETEKDER
ncbi:hypothetical protein SDC9_22468 [bioreactor metagenome]|uniref:Uncharacterized protein n=1 Tax=bioreactor metagenome TaxID=1076179 RepID=A0A644UCA5_9ZZZZ|nr:hypothetical protein [Acidaminococcaceae bacterium]